MGASKTVGLFSCMASLLDSLKKFDAKHYSCFNEAVCSNVNIVESVCELNKNDISLIRKTAENVFFLKKSHLMLIFDTLFVVTYIHRPV